MLEHRSALGSNQYRSDPMRQSPDLQIIAVHDKGLLLLQSGHRAALQEVVNEVLHVALSGEQRAAVAGDCALLWLAPTEWLLELPKDRSDPIGLALTQRLGSLGVVTDLSDGFAVFEVSGSRTPDMLMTGCSLDLALPAFPAGRVVRTKLAEVSAILWNPGNPDRFRCFIDRGFAEHLRTWLDGATVA